MADELNPTAPDTIENSGAYEIIRNRLNQQGNILVQKLNALNERRIETFGSTEMTVIGQTRIRTENNCVPRDVLEMGDFLLFGYNVFVGMKVETAVSDTFSLHKIEEIGGNFEFTPISIEKTFLADTRFTSDFKELYRYYKEARLSQLRNASNKKLAVFQVGSTLADAKVFRWAINNDGTVHYLDNRGERDNVYPLTHDFDWIITTRDDHVVGKHPHVSILDEVFVETVGGTLTVKIEDNTEAGLGIYSEPVDDPNQSLADAQIHYAKLGPIILLKIRPYREEKWRYLLFNSFTKQVNRIDAIGQVCVQLPENHGLIFPGGYYLQSGEMKIFEGESVENMVFERLVRSPNGEDVLYVFYQTQVGKFVLFSYNLIRKEVQNPIICHGYSIFSNGRMVIFRADSDTPARIHNMQIWQTPYTSDDYAAQVPKGVSFIAKIGNPELVRGISDGYSIKRMLDEPRPTMGTYEQLIAIINRAIDAYHWLNHVEVGDLLATLKEILTNVELVSDEFEKVQTLRQQAEKSLVIAETTQQELLDKNNQVSHWRRIDEFVTQLTALRQQRGHLITLREVRYIAVERIEQLEQAVIAAFNQISQATVAFLLREGALQPYHAELDHHLQGIERFKQSHEIKPLQEALDKTGAGLELLTEVIGDLHIEDAAARTRILEDISEVYAKLNRAKAELALRRKELLSTEAVAEFAVQFKLFAQSVAGAMNLADTPEKADEQLSRLLLQLEGLESRFSEFDEFLGQIVEKREEVYAHFEARKQTLLEERQRRALNLNSAADRILHGITRRVATLQSLDDQNAFFAADNMVLKVRDIVKQLYDLGDSVKAGELAGRLKTARDQASRELRDQQEIFAEGGTVIVLGKQRFSVNTQELDLTLIPHAVDNRQQMAIHLTGTGFFQTLDDPQLNAAQAYWEQSLVSESPAVYRSEYLAALILSKARQEPTFAAELQKAILIDHNLLEIVRQFATDRYDEGYERGVHDVDAAAILEKLLPIQATAGLLRFNPLCRALAQLFWAFYDREDQQKIWESSAKSLHQLQTIFGSGWQELANKLTLELSRAIGRFIAKEELNFISSSHASAWELVAHRSNGAHRGSDGVHVPTLERGNEKIIELEQFLQTELVQAGEYLLEELKAEPVRFTASAEAMRLAQGFLQNMNERNQHRNFEEALKILKNKLNRQSVLTQSWLTGYDQPKAQLAQGEGLKGREHYYPEAIAILLTGKRLPRQVNSATIEVEISKLLGQHPRIQNRTLVLKLDEFISRLYAFMELQVPAFRNFRHLRQQIIERERTALRLNEFKPKPLSTFVRNRLINEVYLPLIGNNFAKQLGIVGEQKRTDLMGVLLLISPPGYGKTTLIEYLAQRLGLVFVKVNCPTLGHQVTSIDPQEAPNATAKQELEKLNLALEMGNNVMLYLDDIQHVSPEFLQKFISMADAQRRIDGVWRGVTRTYDMRGKRFCLAMAGNPYTESGETFKIPDMLANRADIYNLGDVLSGKAAAFALSYIENALTSNPVLAPLATRNLEDVYKIVRLAQGEEIPSSELSHNYSATELNEIVTVLKKLFRIQEVLLKVNQQYIASAAQADKYRTEPPFKLQGSYRNMNKLAEKVVAVMNDQELEDLIADHYLGEAQTLTTGAEENLLKLAELRGNMTPQQSQRWEEIKRTFSRLQMQGDEEGEPVTRVVNQLSLLGEQLQSIQRTLVEALQQQATTPEKSQPAREETAMMTQLVSQLNHLTTPLENIQNAIVASTQQLFDTLAQIKLDVNVVNQMPAGTESALQKMVDMIDNTLLSVVHNFERKSRLDLVIWERIKDVSDTLKEVHKEVFMKGKVQRQYQPITVEGRPQPISSTK